MSEKVVANRRRSHAPCRPAVLERRMAETIIGRALVGILEDLVGLVDFLETNAQRSCVAGIAIWMALHRLLAKGGLDVAVGRCALD